jgi:hypothetical protein
MENQCAICLNEVRCTRHNPPIRCGHIFHSHCLEQWKAKGKQTCPICRKIFDGANFKVMVTVTNNFENTSNTHEISAGDPHIFDILDIFFDVGDQTDLNSLLTDFGVSVSDFDPSIFNAEG